MTFDSSPIIRDNTTPSSWEDACLSPYETAQEEGRAQGRRDGSVAGMNQGYQWGQTTALSYGMEIGFMRGVVAVLEERKINLDKVEVRVVKSLQNLRAALDDFPSPDVLVSSSYDRKHRSESDGSATTEETDVTRKFERAQAALKILILQLGLPNLTLQRIMENPSCLNAKTHSSIKRGPQSSDRDIKTTEW